MTFKHLPLRRVARTIAGQSPPSAEVTNLDAGTPFLQGNAEFGERHPSPKYQCNSAAKHARAGDMLVSVRAPVGALNVADQTYAVGRGLCAIRPESASLNDRYLWWALQSRAHRLKSVATGSTYEAVTADDVGALEIPFPAPAAQNAIADFLDAETARIDALIETKRRLSDAVHAKFLDSVDVSTSRGPMTSLRRVIKLRTSGPRGWSARIVDGGGVPFVRSGNLVRDDIELSLDEMAYVPLDKSAEALRSRIATGDVLVGITGANTAWVAVANAPTVGGHVSQHVALLRPSQVTGRWLAYCLFAPSTRRALLESQYGGTKQQLGLDELAELSIAVPSIEDQRHRVDHLNSLRTATVEARQAVARSINLLQERRRALITAAVTGRMAVPGVEAA